jgi:hypothetical protein
MKLKTLKGMYDIVNANHKEGNLHIIINDETCENLQTIFSDKESLARLEIYTDEDVLTSVIPGYVVLEKIELQGDTKTVILGKEADYTEKRITEVSVRLAENAAKTEANTDSIEKQRADLDYMAMQMEVSLDE